MSDPKRPIPPSQPAPKSPEKDSGADGDAGQPAPTAPKKGADGDAGQAEVQATIDQENAQGFRGTKVDPTPDEAYTLPGVARGDPTPETDPDAADDAARALRRQRGRDLKRDT